MAKSFNQLFLDAKETVYSDSVNALTVLAKANPMVAFTPQLMPNGSTSTSQYVIQRRKRPSVNVVANATAGSTSAALAALDQFSEGDWESLPVVTGTLKSVGFKKKFKDDYDYSSNDQHKKDAMYQVGEIAADRKKALNTLLLTAPSTGAALPAYAVGSTNVWNAISDEVIALAQVDDEFKDVQAVTDFITIVSPKVAKELAQEMGIAFRCEAPIAQTGFVSGMNVNGTPVLVEPRFTGREVVILHKESIAFTSAPLKKDYSIDLGLTEFTGEFFYDIMVIVDTKRTALIAAVNPAPPVPVKNTVQKKQP